MLRRYLVFVKMCFRCLKNIMLEYLMVCFKDIFGMFYIVLYLLLSLIGLFLYIVLEFVIMININRFVFIG